MSTADDLARMHEQGLTLLFQRGLELALRIQEDAMAAEAPEERAKLAVAFHRISRSVRQTAALQMRLAREAKRAEREARDEAAGAAKARVERHGDRVRAAVQRLIWTEAEDDEAVSLIADLDDFLEADALDDDFLETPVEAHVARLSEALGLAVAPPAEAADRPAAARPATGLPDFSPEFPRDSFLRGGDHPWQGSG
jgi:hypothetical protein